jgi:GR25 family glycosyltransferase involved in LPS biosynthesis
MQIDIRAIPTYFINLDFDTEKRARVEEIGQQLGLRMTRFEAIKASVGVVGCGLSHIALWESLLHAPFPVLILEDDIELTKPDQFRPVFTIPDDADALFLGISHAGCNTGGGFDSVRFTPVDDALVQVHNMLATHAILFMNPAFMRKCIEFSRHCISNGVAFDFGTATVQRAWRVYAYRHPWFYQADPHKRAKYDVERFTKPPLVDGPPCTSVPLLLNLR